MNFLVDFFNDHQLSITVIIILTIYGFIYTRLVSINLQDYVNENWYRLKDKPWMAPFGGLFNKGKGSGIAAKSASSFTAFFSKILNSFIEVFLRPFIFVLKMFNSMVGKIFKTLDKFRKMAQVVRELFKKIVTELVEKIGNSFAAITYFQEKFKLIIKKQAAMFALFKHFATSLKFILYSFVKGPIPRIINFLLFYGILMLIFLAICLLCFFKIPFVSWVACPICFLCFDENTEILTQNGVIKIKKIKIGDILTDNSVVTSIFKIKVGKIQMYNVRNDIVSGSHLLFENNKWIRVEKSTCADKINYDPNNVIYCLNTTNNLIQTINNKFSDYQETNNININYKINKLITKYLNNGINLNLTSDLENQYYWGFHKNTIIRTNSGPKLIKNIIIGDNLENSEIIGIVKLSGEGVTLYKYFDVIVSGNQVVCEKDLWIRVSQSIYSKKISIKETYIYHVITNNNKLNINNIKFLDFCEVNDELLNDKIDNLVENYKNSI